MSRSSKYVLALAILASGALVWISINGDDGPNHPDEEQGAGEPPENSIVIVGRVEPDKAGNEQEHAAVRMESLEETKRHAP